MQILINFFGSSDFIPHGYCLRWSSLLLWLHVVSDAVITLAYYSIPVSLGYFVRQRKNLPYRWLIVLVALFIVACGTTHLIALITIWFPIYWLDGYVKAFTAIISLTTAVLMQRIIPLALQLPTNDQLQTEMADRIKAQTALEIANARFKALFNNMPNGVAVYEAINEGHDFVFQDFNRAGELLDRIKREDLLNRSITQVFPGVEQFGLLSVLRRVWQTGQAEHLPISLYKDGRLEVYRQNYVYRLPSGEVVAVYEDVSEQKKAEQAQQEASERLQKSEAHYRDTFEYAPIGVVNVALDGRFIAVNQTYCDFVGYSREELLNMTVTELSLAHEKNRHRLIMQQLLNGENANFCIEKQYLRKDGSVVWGNLSAQLNRHSDGSPDYFIATVANIEERKQAEQKLQQQHSLLINVINSMSHPFYVINTDDYSVQLANKSAGEWSKGETTCYQMIHKQNFPCMTVEEHPCPVEEVKRTKKPLIVEHEHINQNGEPHTVEIFAYPIFDAAGEVHQLIEYVIDITERKRMEQQLRDSEAFTNSILNSLTAHIAVLDADGIIIAVNDAWRQFADDNGMPKVSCYTLGASYFEECGKSFTQTHLEEAMNIQYGIMAVLAGTRDSFQFEYPRHLPTEQRWFAVHVSRLNGLQQGVVVSHENISIRKKMEEALRISEAQFRAIIQVSPIPLALNDSQQNITLLNNAFTQTFGYDINDIPTLSHWWLKAYPDPVYRHWVCDIWQESLKRAETEPSLFTPLELTICCKNGTFKTALINASAILDAFEYLHLVMLYDITDRKQAEVELRIAATVFESQEGMLIADINGVIVKVNHAFTLITGYSAQEVIGKQTSLLHSGQHDQAFYDAMWQSINDTGTWQGEIWNRRKNGEIYPEWLTITAVKANNDNTITHYVATLTDITERKAAEETIKQLAFYDPLTNLPNRRLLYERLKHGIEVSCRTDKLIAVLMMDLDKFKAVNDSLGHAAGDELLRQVAGRIKARLREADTVARLGGDEFVILLETITHLEQIAYLAEAIIRTLSEPFILCQTHQVTIGASIGISVYPQHGNSGEELIDNADIALYQAKNNGRGCFAYFS